MSAPCACAFPERAAAFQERLEAAADVTRIRQVLSNLLANALRHTPAGGTITVRLVPAQGGVQFGVTNTGSGLGDADAAQVFQPFWRADAARERDAGGSGPGLSISREIVLLYGGSMAIDRAENEVTFTFTLPGT